MQPFSPSRRAFHTASLAALAAGAAHDAGASPARAAAPNGHPGRPKTFVLVHGAWYGGWCWDMVARALRAEGHLVTAPTLPGLGEQAHLLSKDISLSTFITSISNHIVYQDVKDVVLVGSGFAGAVISGVADRVPQALRMLVFVDAMVLENGQSMFEAQPAAVTRKRLEQVASHGGGIAIPVPPTGAPGLRDPALQAWVRSRLTPHPVGTYSEPLALANALGNGVPRMYVDCVASPFEPLTDVKKLLRAQAGWDWVALPAHHDAMVSDPAMLSALLAAV